MNILFIGDIVGRAGRRAVRKILPELQQDFEIDMIIANGENAAGGFGLTEKVAKELYGYGIDCLTMGNHTWHNKNIFNFIDNDEKLIRPLNYMPDLPGQGWTVIEKNGIKIGVINFIGQVYMQECNSPVMVYDNHISEIKAASDLVVIDFHAEATGEKQAFAHYVDGDVASVVGTHTHVQTSDEKILPKGTGFITDLGLTGAVDSILGMKKQKVIEKYITKLPGRYDVGTGQCQLEGVLVKIDEKSRKAVDITRISRTD